VTRALPGAEATADRLRRLHFDPVVAPLLRVVDLPGGALDLDGVESLAFTSANGVAAFAARSAERGLPVFTVGSATAAAARARGFRDVVSAEGDVDDLCRLIVARPSASSGVVLHPGPAEAAGDLSGMLLAHGVAARRVAVYQTMASPPEPEIAAMMPGLSFVLLHSPKAARALADVLADCPAPGLAAVCLSPAVASPLAGAGLAGVRVSPSPDETALLDTLDRMAHRT
jgi:uroporphyrinogen-III synthase